ncbi:MAG: ABC transporter ATP-binding protein [Thermodesulfobacteriota bacterium]
MSLLTVEHLSKHFDGLKAVDDVSFEVVGKTITSLIGPNGAGKTTIFNMINGLLPASGGQVRYKGDRIDTLAAQKIARLGLGRAFQEPRVFGHMTVLENVLVGITQPSGEGVLAALFPWGKLKRQEKENQASAWHILEFVELADKAGELAKNLSYGQQRFLSVARVLAMEPEILLMDEPTVGLHPEEVSKLMGLLRADIQQKGRTILLVEHNMDVVMMVSDKIILLVEGRIIAQGTPAQMKNNPALWEAYLGVSGG